MERAPANRATWVDHARGLGIVLVVLGHALRGLHDAGLYDESSLWSGIEYLLSTTRMPLFFALTGLFVSSRLAKQGAWPFMRTNLERIAWPYALWSALTSLALTVAGDLANRPGAFSIAGFLHGLLVPSGVFWFLQALLLWHLVSAVLVPRVGVTVVLFLSLLALGLPQVYPELPYGVMGACRFGVFYALGMMFGATALSRTPIEGFSRRSVALLVPVLTGLWLVLAHKARTVGYIGETGTGTGMGWGGPASLPAAMMGVLCASMACSLVPVRYGAWLAAVGRHSLAILVMHVMFTAGVRIVALHGVGMGADQLGLLVVLATTAGVAGPMLVKRLADHLKVSRWLGLH